jgi:hypothetical protein
VTTVNVYRPRLVTRFRSSTMLTRSRVTSRSSRIGAGGMKLMRKMPCRNKSASHSVGHRAENLHSLLRSANNGYRRHDYCAAPLQDRADTCSFEIRHRTDLGRAPISIPLIIELQSTNDQKMSRHWRSLCPTYVRPMECKLRVKKRKVLAYQGCANFCTFRPMLLLVLDFALNTHSWRLAVKLQPIRTCNRSAKPLPR